MLLRFGSVSNFCRSRIDALDGGFGSTVRDGVCARSGDGGRGGGFGFLEGGRMKRVGVM